MDANWEIPSSSSSSNNKKMDFGLKNDRKSISEQSATSSGGEDCSETMSAGEGGVQSGSAAGGATSLKIFRSFIFRNPVDGTMDASRVVSLECYHAWLASRKQATHHPEKVFQRSLSGHITGLDGRTPFTAEEEKAVLLVVRRKERWPCFENSSVRYGSLGFRASGFHERLRDQGEGARVTGNLKAQQYKIEAVTGQQQQPETTTRRRKSPRRMTTTSATNTRPKRQKRIVSISTTTSFEDFSEGDTTENTMTPTFPLSPQSFAGTFSYPSFTPPPPPFAPSINADRVPFPMPLPMDEACLLLSEPSVVAMLNDALAFIHDDVDPQAHEIFGDPAEF